MNRLVKFVNESKDRLQINFADGWFSIQENCMKILQAEEMDARIATLQESVISERSFSPWAGTMCNLPGPSHKLAWSPQAASPHGLTKEESVCLKEINNITLFSWHGHIFAVSEDHVIPKLSHRMWPLLFSSLSQLEQPIPRETQDSIETAFVAHSDTPHDIFGHYIMDYLPQYSFCHEIGAAVNVVCPPPLFPFHNEFLALVNREGNINYHYLHDGVSIKIKKAYFVETPRENQFTFYRASTWALDYFKSLAYNKAISPVEGSNNILYIKRPRRRDLSNLEDLIQALGSKGKAVTVAALEDFNVYQKIELFASHRHLLGVQGSGFAMMPFLGLMHNPSKDLTINMSEICPDSWGAPQYAMISNRLGFNHQIFSVEPANTSDDPLSADISIDPDIVISKIFA
jgi:hypothetical protein